MRYRGHGRPRRRPGAALGDPAQLQDARRPADQDDDGADHGGEEQGYAQREVTVEGHEADRDFALVLEDEYEHGHYQDDGHDGGRD